MSRFTNKNQYFQIPERQSFSPRVSRSAYANDFSALNPALWANEILYRLMPELVIGNLINMNFANAPAKFGDVVNAIVPGDFTFSRKGALCENVVSQDASATTIQVPMDQWPQIAFTICDGEEDRNFLDLTNTLLIPAVNNLAEGIDRIAANQVYQFATGNNVAGHLGKLSTTNFLDYLVDTMSVMDNNNVPQKDRALIIGNKTKAQALKNVNLLNAAFVGADSTALRKASLGELMNFNIVGGSTQPSVGGGQTLVTALINNAAGYPAGSVSIVYDNDSPTDGFNVGQWIVVDGDDTPQHITAIDTTGNALTITPGLRSAVVDNAPIKAVKSAAVNNASGYAGTTTTPHVIGYAKQILIDGIANSAPKIGQMVTFGTSNVKYGIIRVDIINLSTGNFGIWLDRPLVAALADNDVVNFGPTGEYNLALLPNAFTLVNRPPPKPKTGVIASVINNGKIAIRVTISYDAKAQGHLVVIDTLMGVGVVDPNVAAVMFG